MTAAELQARLAQPYDRASWLDTLGKSLPRTEIFAAPQPVPADTTRAESIVQLGKVHLAGQRNLALLEVTVGDRVDLLRNRVGLRQLVARYIDQAEYHGVLAIFHQRDAKDYRFTFAAREAALDAGGQLVRHETAPRRYSYLMTFTKEQAGMAYLAVFRGASSRLRNSLSRREFFRQGDEYYLAFNLRGSDGEAQPGALPDGFKPGQPANGRALQILAARSLEEGCRSGIADIQDKQERGSLRKGAYYLARIIYLKQQTKIDDLVAKAAPQDRKAEVPRKLTDALSGIVTAAFDDARKLFQQALKDYVAKEGGNEDAALKNTEFAKKVDALARPPQPKTPPPEK